MAGYGGPPAMAGYGDELQTPNPAMAGQLWRSSCVSQQSSRRTTGDDRESRRVSLLGSVGGACQKGENVGTRDAYNTEVRVRD